MLVAAKIDGEFSTLEVYLYEENKCNYKEYQFRQFIHAS